MMKYEEEIFNALLDGDIEEAMKWISEGADIHESTPSDNWTYFHLIFISPSELPPLKSIHFLLEQGLDVNAIDDSYGNTPLLYAVRQRNIDGIRLLLENGADKLIEHENHDGVSALRMGLDSMPLNYDVFEILLKYGANPDAIIEDGKTVRQMLSIIAGVPSNIEALFAKY